MQFSLLTCHVKYVTDLEHIQKYAGLWDFSVAFPSAYDWLCWMTQARMLTVVDALQVCDVCFVSVHNLLVQEKNGFMKTGN